MSNWKSAYGALETKAEVRGTHGLPPRSFSGQVLGIIAVKLDYPKLPGNVANACTFNYPVCYEVVDFEIEQLFAGDPAIKQMIIEAAKKLEAQGVRAIIGACGYFAHFQKDVAAAVDVYSCRACASCQLSRRALPRRGLLRCLPPMDPA